MGQYCIPPEKAIINWCCCYYYYYIIIINLYKISCFLPLKNDIQNKTRKTHRHFTIYFTARSTEKIYKPWAMFFSMCHKNDSFDLKINSHNLPKSECTKYLDAHMDNKFHKTTGRHYPFKPHRQVFCSTSELPQCLQIQWKLFLHCSTQRQD